MTINKEEITKCQITMKSAVENHPRRERRREYLTPTEVDKLLCAAKKQEHNPERNYCLLLLMYHHGLRVSEACQLKLNDIDLGEKVIHIKRLKNGKSAVQPIYPSEVKALRDWLKVRETMGAHGDALFISERNQPMNRATVNVIVNKVAEAAGLSSLYVHPHQLRHACGYFLANEGRDTRSIQDHLGHRSIQHTVRYTELAPGRSANFFR